MRGDLTRSEAQRRSAAAVLMPPDGEWQCQGGAPWGYLPMIAAPVTRGNGKAMTAARATLAGVTYATRVLLLIPVVFFLLIYLIASVGSMFAGGPW
jgi:hypothetical protein